MPSFNFKPIIPRKFNQAEGLILKASLSEVMRDVVSDGQRYISWYPPQILTKSGYRRTNTLKRSWSSEVKQTTQALIGVVGSNGNIAPYNIFVQGEQQRELFAGVGWFNVHDLKIRMSAELTRRAAEAVKRWAERLEKGT